MKICDLWVKVLNRGFGSSRGTWNRVTTMWIFFILISNFWALRGILRELLNILRLLFSPLVWVPRLFLFLFFCFTKLLRPLVRRWRLMSHNCFVYLDDKISGQRVFFLSGSRSLRFCTMFRGFSVYNNFVWNVQICIPPILVEVLSPHFAVRYSCRSVWYLWFYAKWYINGYSCRSVWYLYLPFWLRCWLRILR